MAVIEGNGPKPIQFEKCAFVIALTSAIEQIDKSSTGVQQGEFACQNSNVYAWPQTARSLGKHSSKHHSCRPLSSQPTLPVRSISQPRPAGLRSGLARSGYIRVPHRTIAERRGLLRSGPCRIMIELSQLQSPSSCCTVAAMTC
jgi:hypothetical protein